MRLQVRRIEDERGAGSRDNDAVWTYQAALDSLGQRRRANAKLLRQCHLIERESDFFIRMHHYTWGNVKNFPRGVRSC